MTRHAFRKFEAPEIYERSRELHEFSRHYLTDESIRDAPDRETVEAIYTLRRAMRTVWFAYGGGPAGDAVRKEHEVELMPLDECYARLRALDCTPTCVNGVPVKKRPCSPAMYEVTMFHFTVQDAIGLGSGARLPHVEVLGIHDAALRVHSGRCAHHVYSGGVWRECQ